MNAPLADRALVLWRNARIARRLDPSATFNGFMRAHLELMGLRYDDHPLIRRMAGIVPVRAVQHGGDAA